MYYKLLRFEKSPEFNYKFQRLRYLILHYYLLCCLIFQTRREIVQARCTFIKLYST